MSNKKGTTQKIINKIYGNEMPAIDVTDRLITQKLFGEDFTRLDIDEELYKKFNKKKSKKEEK